MADALLNPQALANFIRAVSGSRDAEVLARVERQICENPGKAWRAPDREELREIDRDGAIALQMELLGRKFYMFDAGLDAGLEDEIRARAKKTEAELPETRQREMHSFNKAVTGTGLRERQEQKRISVQNAKMRAQQRHITQLADLSQIDAVNRALGNAIPDIGRNGPRRNLSNGQSVLYYGVADGDGRKLALLEVRKTDSGSATLRMARGANGHFPDLSSALHIAKFAYDWRMDISGNSGDTGLAQTGPGLIVPLEDLPDEFISEKPLIVAAAKSEISLGFLRRIHGPAGTCTIFSNCPGLRTLGFVEHCANTLHVENCENFHDIGSLKKVGPVNADCGADLILRGCRKLLSLSGLEEVYGDLDLRGTSVKVMPLSLKKVRGIVRMDTGTFRFSGHGAATPLVPYEPKNRPGSWTL